MLKGNSAYILQRKWTRGISGCVIIKSVEVFYKKNLVKVLQIKMSNKDMRVEYHQTQTVDPSDQTRLL